MTLVGLREISWSWRRSLWTILLSLIAAAGLGGAVWFQARYDEAPDQTIELRAFSNAEYPEDPENRSRVFGNYPHQLLRI